MEIDRCEVVLIHKKKDHCGKDPWEVNRNKPGDGLLGAGPF